MAQPAFQENPTFSAIRGRKTARNFSARPVADALLLELLSLANHAPSGFDLQPWHFVVVRDRQIKEALFHVAMDQQPVLDAPVTIVFVADPRAWITAYKQILQKSLASEAFTKEKASTYAKSVRLLFQTGPFGIFGMLKRIFAPVVRLATPVPNLITSFSEAVSYVNSQTMLAAATYIVAAKSAGLDTCPMEGFDEVRLKKLLGLPEHMKVPIIVPTGYSKPLPQEADGIRFNIGEKVSIDSFQNKLGQALGDTEV